MAALFKNPEFLDGLLTFWTIFPSRFIFGETMRVGSDLNFKNNSKHMPKVNLDALIPREDFEVKVDQSQIASNTLTIKLTDLKSGEFFFSQVRKPDFQRETNEWSSQKIVGLIESYINGDLIPAIILWHGSGYTFVIDGSHRLSALAAWVNDDYGDKTISRSFYSGIIPDDQINIAEATRSLINKRIGSYSDYEFAVKNADKVKPEIYQKAKNLGILSLQLQWVGGNADKAEESFFKINKEASPINKTELTLLKARKKPNGLAARAIIRSGMGHKYWAKFEEPQQIEIEKIATKINHLLFVPPLKTPIKTLELPIAGKQYSSQALPLILNFINIVNNLPADENKIEDDHNGSKTIEVLNKCKEIANRINSDDSGSLGLHPAIYFYSKEGRHKPVSFYAITALMLELNNNTKLLDRFIKVRSSFEEILIEYDYFVPQILRRYRSGADGYGYVKNFYLEVINNLNEGLTKTDAITKLLSGSFSYLTTTIGPENNAVIVKDFSSEIKSEVFLRNAIGTALKCKICGGYMHSKSITTDHKKEWNGA